MNPSYILLLIVFSMISCRNKNVEFQEITLMANPCLFGECPIFDISIKNDGNASYNAISDNPISGDFKTKIIKRNLDSLKGLMDEVKILKLEGEYSEIMTDHAPYNILVKYNDGQSIIVLEYGPSGPKKLNNLFNYILTLRDSQDWK